MGNYIDSSANIIHSSISDSAQIWKNVRIEGSTIASLSSVGDDSIVINSILGEKCEIGRHNIISNIRMGKGSSTQSNTTIRYAEIGKFCAIAWNVTIGAPNHEMRCLAMAHPDYIFADETRPSLPSYHNEECIIGNDVWICAGAHVTRGVTVADGAVIAANAVVTKDVPHYAVVAGVPAKVTGYRFGPRTIERLKKIRWWELPQNVLDQCRECFHGDLTDEKLSILESKIQDIPEGKDNGR